MNDNTTKCPAGAAWCTQHSVLGVDGEGDPIEHHSQTLYAHCVPAQPERPVTVLFVSEVAGYWGIGPEMALRQYDDTPPQTISPEDARELAAALLRGAEIVEAARTETCPSCGAKVMPGRLDEDSDGICFDCVTARFNARRAALNVVQ